MYLRNIPLFIPVLFHRISFEGIIRTRVYEHGFDDGIKWGKIIFSKVVPIVANDTVDSTNGVIGCRKNTFRVMVLLADNDCAIDRTGSSTNFIRANY